MYNDYYNSNSIIHKINPIIKIIIFLMISINILFIDTFIETLILLLYLLIILLISKVPLKELSNSVRKRYLIILMITLVILLIDNSLYHIIRIILLTVNLIILLLTTKEKEINYGTKKVFSILDSVLSINSIINFFNNVTLMINIFDYKYQQEKKLQMLSNQKISVKEIYVNCQLEYQEIKKNKAMKMYNKDINRTVYNVNPIKLIDILLLISSIILFVITLL